MRHLFTTEDSGETSAALRWGERKGKWRRVQRGVYAMGPEEPSKLDRQRARVLASGGVASGALAGVLHGLDGVVLDDRPLRRRTLPEDRVVVVGDVRCADGLQTLVDLASTLTDDAWEQALESALRKGRAALGDLPARGRIRRVLARRPPGAPPTESLLETLMVQLARTVPGLPDPVRQLEVGHARLDLAWPGLGLFIELDGQHHKDQPVYDAMRETAVVAATGWLPGRFTWTELTRLKRTTQRRLAALADQARDRPQRGDDADDHHGQAPAHRGAGQLAGLGVARRAHERERIAHGQRAAEGQDEQRKKVLTEEHGARP